MGQYTKRARSVFLLFSAIFFFSFLQFPYSSKALALDLDWSGQFRAESHWILNYPMEGASTVDAARRSAEGYYIPGGGEKSAFFQTLFMRLRPSLIANDNVYIKSEWWVGDPVYGVFGDSFPYTTDQRQFYSSQSRGSFIRAQRFWAELLTDFGTLQVGRVPLHWGLGVFWNRGDGLYDRYASTGDAFRLISKFGAFSFVPAIIKYSEGNSIGGACLDPSGANPCSVVGEGGGLTDYSLAFQYENLDEDVELGLNFIRRIGGGAQDPSAGVFGIEGIPAGMSYNIWDFYGRKKLGRFTLAGEVPVTSGNIGGTEYKAFAVALEGTWEVNESLTSLLRAGHVPGQPGFVGVKPGTFRAFYLNPNYRIGTIMFNYQFQNFHGPGTQHNPSTSQANLASPFDNPVTNANYLAIGSELKVRKWRFHLGLAYAKAIETATAGTKFFNSWKRKFVDFDKLGTGGVANQSDDLGFEIDFGTSLLWDDSFRFDLDFGWYFPGDYYAFSNTNVVNGTAPVFGTVFRVGVDF